MSDTDSELLVAPLTIEYPFLRTTGPVIGAFLTALVDSKVIGIRAADGRVVCPPVEYDPVTAEPLTELVEVGTSGVVTSCSWVSHVRDGQALDRPHYLALIQLDGADTSMMHVVDAPQGSLSVGDRVHVRWRNEREGLITDIEAFEREDH